VRWRLLSAQVLSDRARVRVRRAAAGVHGVRGRGERGVRGCRRTLSPEGRGRSTVTTAAASALLGGMDSPTTTAAAAAAVVLASAEAQSILEDVCGTSSIISNANVHTPLSSSVDVGGPSRRNSNVAATAGMPPSSSKQEAALLPEQQQQLEAAIQLLPEADKVAYREALMQSPHLIALESPLRRYWQIESDPREAARRLCAYWHQRKLCFGSRACLPMVQTGKGTLSPEDVELLASGFCMLLPPDRHGRIVLLHDRGRLTNLDAERRLRCIFYLLHVASEQQPSLPFTSPPPGLVWITVYSDKTRASAFDVHTVTRTIQICASGAFPVQFKAFHLIMLTNRPILDSVVPTTLEILQQNFPHLHQRTMVHPKLPLPELLKELEAKYGLDPEHLPKVPLGGRWTIGSFKRWRDDRLYDEQKRLEKIKIKQQTVNNAGIMTGTGRATLIHAAEEEPREQEMILPPPPPNLVDSIPQSEHFYYSEDYDEEEKASSSAMAELEEDERRKRRAVDAMYARRRRVRRKIEMEGMQEQVLNLRQQKMRLQQTHQLLIGLLHRAEECVRQETLSQVTARETDVVMDMATSQVREGSQSSVGTDMDKKEGTDTALNPGDEYSAKDHRERANVTSPSIASSNFPESDSAAATSATNVSVGTDPKSQRSIGADTQMALTNTREEHLTKFEPPIKQVNEPSSQQSALDIPETKMVENEPTKPTKAEGKVRTGIGDMQFEIMQQSTLATKPAQEKSREERQQALVQSWHEQYAQYQMQVNMYVQQRREEQQAAVAAVATAALQETFQLQAQYQTSSMMGSVVNEHLLQQAWLVWMRQQQLQEGRQQQAQQQESPQSQQGDPKEHNQS